MGKLLNSQINNFLEFTAFLGFLVTATLFINLNFKGFKTVFREKTLNYWWLFILLTVAPLLVIIYIFTLLFR